MFTFIMLLLHWSAHFDFINLFAKVDKDVAFAREKIVVNHRDHQNKFQ